MPRRRVRVIPEKRDEIDVKLFATALLAFALQFVQDDEPSPFAANRTNPIAGVTAAGEEA
jgi:hypothetical protein